MPEGLEEAIIRAVRDRVYGEVSVRLDQRSNQILIGIRLPSIGNSELAWTYMIDMSDLQMSSLGNPAQDVLMRADRFARTCRNQVGEELVRRAENAFREREQAEQRFLRREETDRDHFMWDRDVGENLPWGTYAADRGITELPPPVTLEELAKTMKELNDKFPDKPTLPKTPPKKRCELIREDPFQ